MNISNVTLASQCVNHTEFDVSNLWVMIINKSE